MIKTLSNIFKQDKEKFVIPRSVQQVIPIETIWSDGIFKIGRNKFARTYKFTDINYAVASKVDKETMFLEYMDLLNSFDCGGTTKITINNRRLNKVDFEKAILIPMQEDGLDLYRKEYNNMLLDKATSSNSMVQEKYVTVSCYKKTIEEARTYFARVTTELNSHFARLGSKCVEINGEDKLRILHDFYRTGEESGFHFDIQENMRKGHSFKDYICPDTFEFEKDYFRMGDRYGRVLFLREYASYIKDDMIAELTDMNRNLMLSIDVIPVPTDEAVKEAENRLLGVETNITNWQRRQNANNNFSATVPYDMEQQKKEMIFHENGIYYGQNVISKNMIIADRKQLLNGNSFILGVSGGGKSFAAKGEVINISATSDNHINAMDMNKDYGDGANPVILKSEFIMSLCEQLIGGTNLRAKQKSIIDRCTASVYRSYQQNDYQGHIPTLQDFRAELLQQDEPEAKELALAIELFTHGSLNTFAKQTNVDINNRLICYDILDLGKQLMPIGML